MDYNVHFRQPAVADWNEGGRYFKKGRPGYNLAGHRYAIAQIGFGNHFWYERSLKRATTLARLLREERGGDWKVTRHTKNRASKIMFRTDRCGT